MFSHGYAHSFADPCPFYKGANDSFIALIVYVDDVLVTSSSLELVAKLKGFLHQAFTFKDLGEAKYFLLLWRLFVVQHVLNQRKYILDILSSVSLLGCISVATPLPAGVTLSSQSTDLFDNQERYTPPVSS